MSARDVIANLRELASLTSDADGAQRVAWGPVWREARRWLAGKLRRARAARRDRRRRQQLGHAARRFAAHASSSAAISTRCRTAAGSTGALGVLAGIEALRCYARRTTPPVTLAVVDWADEEGARFGRSLLGLVGAPAARSCSTALRAPRGQGGRRGCRCAARERRRSRPHARRARRARRAIDARAYLELHIEQGPVLESMDKPTGVVLGTFGVERHVLRFTGQAAHSGSTPIPMRRDAFLAAAETALACRDIAPAATTPDAGVVCTVGTVQGRARDRHRRAGRVRDLARSARARSRRARPDARRGARRGRRRPRATTTSTVEWRHVWRIEPRPFDPRLIELCAEAVREDHRRRPAPAVRSAARRRGDGAAHAGGDDVRLFVERAVALQGRGHARADLEQTIDAFLRLVEKTVAAVAAE